MLGLPRVFLAQRYRAHFAVLCTSSLLRKPGDTEKPFGSLEKPFGDELTPMVATLDDPIGFA
jgi:hypothetical protein